MDRNEWNNKYTVQYKQQQQVQNILHPHRESSVSSRRREAGKIEILVCEARRGRVRVNSDATHDSFVAHIRLRAASPRDPRATLSVRLDPPLRRLATHPQRKR